MRPTNLEGSSLEHTVGYEAAHTSTSPHPHGVPSDVRAWGMQPPPIPPTPTWCACSRRESSTALSVRLKAESNGVESVNTSGYRKLSSAYSSC